MAPPTVAALLLLKIEVAIDTFLEHSSSHFTNTPPPAEPDFKEVNVEF